MDDKKQPSWPAETEGPSSEVFDTLADVLREEEKKAKVRDEIPVPWGRRHRLPLLISLLFLTVLSFFLWVFPPGWLLPNGPPSLSPAVADAGLRMEVYLQAVRILDFQAREGRLPNSLEEAGDPHSAVRYERLDPERFRVSVQGPEGSATFDSGQSLSDFLGNAPAILGVGP